MTGPARCLRAVGSVALLVMIGVGLVSCGGGGSRQTVGGGGDEMIIMPPSPTTGRPDLSVGSPSVDDAHPEAGGSFTLSATVRNEGDAEAPATTLRWYRSADATITTSDTAVGTDAVAALAVAGVSRGSVDLAAPSTAGPYYYGACVDAVTAEADTANNCSASVRVTVTALSSEVQGQDPPDQAPQGRGPPGQNTKDLGQRLHDEPPGQEPPQGRPDMVVSAVSVSNANPETGATVNLVARVRNMGDGEAPATTLRYYRSTDATITTADTEIGTDAIATLAARTRRAPRLSTAVSIILRAPSTAGVYYFGACVDTVPDESDTGNNCSSALRLDVIEPPPRYDVYIDSITVTPASPKVNETATFTVTVGNKGDVASPARSMDYWLKAGYSNICNPNRTVADYLGSVQVASLAAGQKREYQVSASSESSYQRTFTAGVCGPEGSNSIRICSPTGSRDPDHRNNKDCITVNFVE